jgi:homoserine kinase
MLSETKEIAEKVAENMQKIYNEIGIENYVYVSKINDQGNKVPKKVDGLIEVAERSAIF